MTEVDTHASHRRPTEPTLERALWASAFVALGIGVLGWRNPLGWKVLEMAAGYPALWVSAAFVLLTFSTFVGHRVLFLRVVAVSVTSVVCLVGRADGVRNLVVRLGTSRGRGLT